MTEVNKSTEQDSILLVAPKTVKHEMFLYRSIEDLANLIKYVGKPPRITEKMVLIFNRKEVTPMTAIEVNEYGEVIHVISYQELSAKFDLISAAPFQFDKNRVIKEKPAKVKK